MKRRSLCLFVLGLSLLLSAVVLLSCRLLFPAISYPVATPSNEALVVRIPAGASLREIGDRLQAAGLISHARLFSAYAALLGVGRKIRAGEYRISPRMTSPAILSLLVSGAVILHPLTFREGLTIDGVTEINRQSGLVQADEFQEVVRGRELLAEANLPGENMEGYLFPDTYLFRLGTGGREAAKAMLREFLRVRKRVDEQESAGTALSPYEELILASMIEKETGIGAERPMISAVFHSRLRQDMLLQCDPTVIYALGAGFDGVLGKDELALDSPYNTYRFRGLPPGPICNPGRASLEAARRPAEVDYLFFVARPDGTHTFSRTLEEHNSAVDIQQALRALHDRNRALGR